MSVSESHDQKSLYDLFWDIWRARLFILTGLTIGAICAGLFLFVAYPHQKAHMIISPANPMNGAEASSLLADDNLFALRYLVQRVGVSESSDFQRFQNIYAGASVASRLLKDSKILSGLKIDQRFKFSEPQAQWSAEELGAYIEKRVMLEPVSTTAMKRMRYLHVNSDFAKYFLHAIHKTTDELIRERLNKSASARVQYLKETVRNTSNPEHRRALTTLLLEQERLRMLVSIEAPYAASIVEPPAISPKVAWPSGALTILAFISSGALVGFIVFGVRAAVQGQGFHMPSRDQWHKWFHGQTQNQNEKNKPLTQKKVSTARRK